MKNFQKLDQSFYTNENVVAISQQLLGKVIVTTFNGQKTSGMIVETEAYQGPEDKACHAYMNKKTKRTTPMFEQGGCSYIYLIYGIHPMFNVVTNQKGVPHAVLIRGIEPLEGIDVMLKRRNYSTIKYALTAGPGSLAKALGLTTEFTNQSLTTHPNIWIEDRNISFSTEEIIASPRVNIDYAGDIWKNKPWRFRVKNSKWTSK